jgi:hypothetical protein
LIPVDSTQQNQCFSPYPKKTKISLINLMPNKNEILKKIQKIANQKKQIKKNKGENNEFSRIYADDICTDLLRRNLRFLVLGQHERDPIRRVRKEREGTDQEERRALGRRVKIN